MRIAIFCACLAVMLLLTGALAARIAQGVGSQLVLVDPPDPSIRNVE